MADYYVRSGSGATQRANSTAYSAGARIVPARSDTAGNVAVAKKWVWEVTTGGTSGAAVPTWAATVNEGDTLADGTCTLTARKPGYSAGGTTVDWTFATIYLDYATSAATAGDTIYVANDHAESIAGALFFNPTSTIASPANILCVNYSASPLTLASTGEIATTGNNSISFSQGNGLYVYGLLIKAGVSTSSGGISISNTNTGGDAVMTFEKCEFWIPNNNSSGSRLFIVNSSSSNTTRAKVLFKDVNMKFSNAANFIQLQTENFVWRGGSIVSGTVALTSGLISNSGATRGASFLFEGVDLTNFGNSNIVRGDCVGTVVLRNCKLPGSWTGSIIQSGGNAPNLRAELYNCASGDTNYKLAVVDYYGTVDDETTIYRTSGASDGTTNLSWKMVRNSTATPFPMGVLESSEIMVWNDTTGSSKTATVEFLIDSATTLYTGDVWMELQYLGNSGTSQSSFDLDSRKTDILAANTTECTAGAGTSAWTGKSGSAKSYKLVSTFTPQEKGPVIAKVYVAKTSTTIYVDPMITIA